MARPRDQADRTSLTPEEFAERAQEIESGRDFSVNVGTFLRHEFGTTHVRLHVDDRRPAERPDAGVDAGRPGARGARARAARSGPGRSTDFDDFSLYDRCITRGVLGSLLPVIYGNGVRITQNPESVAISYEMIHDTRIIPLDGRPALDHGIRQYMGSARGRFEGDTLVVETTNFTDRTSVGTNGGGPPNTRAAEAHGAIHARRPRDDRVRRDRRRSRRAYTAPWTIRAHDHDAPRLRGARVLVPRGQRRRRQFALAASASTSSKSPKRKPKACRFRSARSSTSKSATACRPKVSATSTSTPASSRRRHAARIRPRHAVRHEPARLADDRRWARSG